MRMPCDLLQVALRLRSGLAALPVLGVPKRQMSESPLALIDLRLAVHPISHDYPPTLTRGLATDCRIRPTAGYVPCGALGFQQAN